MVATPVRRAVRSSLFRVHAVATVDAALELLTGLPAGAPDEDRRYPADSVNGRVQAALAGLADVATRFAMAGPSETARGRPVATPRTGSTP
jgi:hypothetical protein